MPVIGEGAYGKVYKPPKQCRKDYDVNNKVGKVFKSMYDYKNELQTMFEVKKINSRNDFTIPIYHACPEVMQLIYADGGKDLYDYIQINRPSLKGFMGILNQMRYICRGLVMLEKHGYVHQDIKLENLVYNGKRLYLIDFGLMMRMSEVYSHKTLLAFDYIAYPPEYKRFLEKRSFFERFKKNFRVNPRLLSHIGHYYENMKKDLGTILVDPSYPTDKIDVYSLGIVIAELYQWYRKSGHALPEVESLISGMICIDPKKRLSSAEASIRIDNIMKSRKHV